MKTVLFFIFGLFIFTSNSHASEVSNFRADWCSPNQLVGQDIKIVCFGDAQFQGTTTRAIAIKRANQVNELFIETDYTSVDLFNLQVTVLGPVASSQPRNPFAAKYTGQVKMAVDDRGEVRALQGTLRFTDSFYATREN